MMAIMGHSSTYRCDKCQSEQSASSLRLRQYVLGVEERLPVRACLAWCPESNSLAARELLPDLDSIVAALDHLEAQEQSLGDDMEAIVALMQQVIAWLKERQSPARCLACGATGAENLSDENNNDPREFPHPGCGGTYRWIAKTPLQDAVIELYTPEGLAWQAPPGMPLEDILDYFRQAISSPLSVLPWSEWWAENEQHVSQAFPLVDYVRLKHRRLTGARQILQNRGELAKDFVPPSASVTGSCEKCGDRVADLPGPEGTVRKCPRCDA